MCIFVSCTYFHKRWPTWIWVAILDFKGFFPIIKYDLLNVFRQKLILCTFQWMCSQNHVKMSGHLGFHDHVVLMAAIFDRIINFYRTAKKREKSMFHLWFLQENMTRESNAENVILQSSVAIAIGGHLGLKQN